MVRKQQGQTKCLGRGGVKKQVTGNLPGCTYEVLGCNLSAAKCFLALFENQPIQQMGPKVG